MSRKRKPEPQMNIPLDALVKYGFVIAGLVGSAAVGQYKVSAQEKENAVQAAQIQELQKRAAEHDVKDAGQTEVMKQILDSMRELKTDVREIKEQQRRGR